MKKIIILIIIISLITFGCSSKQQKVTGQHTDITPYIKECVVYDIKVECLMTDGNYAYARMDVLEKVTRWDKTAWEVK